MTLAHAASVPVPAAQTKQALQLPPEAASTAARPPSPSPTVLPSLVASSSPVSTLHAQHPPAVRLHPQRDHWHAESVGRRASAEHAKFRTSASSPGSPLTPTKASPFESKGGNKGNCSHAEFSSPRQQVLALQQQQHRRRAFPPQSRSSPLLPMGSLAPLDSLQC